MYQLCKLKSWIPTETPFLPVWSLHTPIDISCFLNCFKMFKIFQSERSNLLCNSNIWLWLVSQSFSYTGSWKRKWKLNHFSKTYDRIYDGYFVLVLSSFYEKLWQIIFLKNNKNLSLISMIIFVLLFLLHIHVVPHSFHMLNFLHFDVFNH